MGAALGTPAVTHPPPAEILEAEKADKVERSGEALPAASETHSLNGFAQCAHVPPTETHTSLSLFSARVYNNFLDTYLQVFVLVFGFPKMALICRKCRYEYDRKGDVSSTFTNIPMSNFQENFY